MKVVGPEMCAGQVKWPAGCPLEQCGGRPSFVLASLVSCGSLFFVSFSFIFSFFSSPSKNSTLGLNIYIKLVISIYNKHIKNTMVYLFIQERRAA